MKANGRTFGAALAAVAALLALAHTPASAALLVDTALTNTGQIRSAANDPYFGAGNTVDWGAVNLSYNTPVGAATLNGIGFHDLDLQSNPRTGSGIPVTYALPGITMDFTFDGDADMPGSRNLTSVSLTGPDAAVGNQVALGNRYISVTTNHRPNLITFHGAQGDQPVYVQLIGGQHGWNGDTYIYVNGDGSTEGSGTLVGTWNSNKTNRTAGLAAFEATTNASGDLTLEVQSGFFSGLAAVIVQAEGPPPPPPPPLVNPDGTPNPARPNFKLWYDANDPATLTVSGGRVSQWNDKTAVPENASQPNASLRPALAAGAIGGKDAVRFNGASEFLDAAGVTLDASKTIFLVVDDTGTTSPLAGVVSTPVGNNGVTVYRDDQEYVVDWPGAGPGNSANTPVPAGFSILTAKYDNTNGTISIFQDGAPGEVVATTRGAAGTDTFRLGQRVDAYSRYFKGDIAEVLVYDGILTGKDEVAVGSYLAAKYGLPHALSLATDNPYAQRVLGDKPMGYWRFESGAGNVALDLAGEDVLQHGIYKTGAAAAPPTLVPGPANTIGGTGVNLDTLSYVDFSTAGDFNMDTGPNGKPFTMEAWVQKDTNFGGFPNYRRIFDKVGAGTPNGWGMDMHDGKLRMLGNVNVEADLNTLDDFGWHYVVGVSDGAGTGRIYADGRLIGSGPYAAANAYAGPFRLGVEPGGSSHFNGAIDEAALYGHALSSARVLEHWTASTITGPGGRTQSFRRGENGYDGVEDTRLVSGPWQDRNFGATNVHLGVGTWANPLHSDRGILRFDLSGLNDGLGTYAVSDGTLMLTVSLNQSFVGDRLDLYRIDPANAAWIEGVNTGGGANTGEATWNSREHGLAGWLGGAGLGAPGDGYDAVPLDSIIYGGEEIVYLTIPADVLNDWIYNPSDNAGLMIRAADEGNLDHRLFFYPSEADNIEFRPFLVFNTAVPEPLTLTLLGLGVLGLAGYARRRRP